MSDQENEIRPEFIDGTEGVEFPDPGPTEVVDENDDVELADDQDADPDEEAEGSDDVEGEGVGADDGVDGSGDQA